MDTIQTLLSRTMIGIRYLAGAGMMIAAANVAVSGFSAPMVAGFTACAAGVVVSPWYAREVGTR